MDEMILQKARELADMIRESDLFLASKAAEKAAYADASARFHVADYYAKEQALRTLLNSGNIDPDALAKAGRDLEDAEEAMQNDPLVLAMQQANKACNELLTQIGGILSQAVRSEEEGSCGGSCATCSAGCASRQ